MRSIWVIKESVCLKKENTILSINEFENTMSEILSTTKGKAFLNTYIILNFDDLVRIFVVVMDNHRKIFLKLIINENEFEIIKSNFVNAKDFFDEQVSDDENDNDEADNYWNNYHKSAKNAIQIFFPIDLEKNEDVKLVEMIGILSHEPFESKN